MIYKLQVDHMIIACAKERKTLEQRVAITPLGVKELVKAGHQVLIEQSAGLGSFYSDQDYISSGAKICSQTDLWKSADLVIKVKEPEPSELELIRENQIIFTYLHLASSKIITEALCKRSCTAIAYELIEDPSFNFPLLKPMSEIAGKLAVQNGSNYLLSQNGGRGVLLGGTETVSPATVTIIGAGNAGIAALKVANGMGANVNLFDIRDPILKQVKQNFPYIKTYNSNLTSIRTVLPTTDLLILAVLIPGAKAPKILSSDDINFLPKGSVIVDISIDQGGAAETIKATSLKEPVYLERGILHYAVPNMPAQTARTSTEALTKVTLDYIIQIANLGNAKLLSNSIIRKAICTFQGNLTNQAIANTHQLDYTSL